MHAPNMSRFIPHSYKRLECVSLKTKGSGKGGATALNRAFPGKRGKRTKGHPLCVLASIKTHHLEILL